MMKFMESNAAGSYEEMQSISCAFAIMAVLFLAAGTACFFINKIYHSINVTLYFLKRKGEKKHLTKGRLWKKFTLLLLILIGLCYSEEKVYGADSGTKDIPGEYVTNVEVPETGDGEDPDISAGNGEVPGTGDGEDPDITAGNGEVPETGDGEDPDISAGNGEVPETEDKDDLDIPSLYVETGAEFIKKGEEKELFLTDKKGGVITLILTEANYLSNVGQERGELFLNIDEEGKKDILSYNWETLISRGEGVWSVDIPLEGKKNKEIRYQIVFNYQDQVGHGLQAGDRDLDAFGRVKDGCFKSFWFVVDGKPPLMEEKISLEGKGTSGKDKEGILAEPEFVTGKIQVQENNLDRSQISLIAKPLDKRARKTVRESEQILPDGNLDIPAFTVDQKDDKAILWFRFREEGRWQLLFSCVDQAGNEGRTGSGQSRAASREFIVDHTAPRLSIAYSPEVSILRKRFCPEDVQVSSAKALARVNVRDCQVVFPGQQEVLVRINETYFDPDRVEIQLLKETWKYQYPGGLEQEKTEVSGSWDQEPVKNLERYLEVTDWEETEEGVYLARVRLKKEGDYRLLIHYKDSAGRNIKPDNSGMENCDLFFEKGVYKGPVITVDRSVPSFLFVLCQPKSGRPVVKSGGKGQLFKEEPEITLRISDKNFCGGRLMIRDQVLYADGSEAKGKGSEYDSEDEAGIRWKRLRDQEEYVYEAQFPVVQEGNHRFSFRYVDMAGHSSDRKEIHFTYDSQGPVVSCEQITDRKGKVIDLTRKDSREVYLKDRIGIQIQVRDAVSGVGELWYRFSGTYSDERGKEYSRVPEYRKLSPESGNPQNPAEYTFWLEPEEDNFIGQLELYCIDGAGNYSNLVKSRQLIIESEQFHDIKSRIEWDIPAASYLNEEDKILYFQNNVGIKVRFTDSWSGIRAWTILVSKKHLSVTDVLNSCKEIQRSTRVSSLEREYLIDAESFHDCSPDQPLVLYAAFIDNAGHYKVSAYEDYRIVMDKKKPVVEVSYDLKGSRTQGLYFNRTRTAKISVTDRNFNPESVTWDIKGSREGWEIGPWTKEGDRCTCEVFFSKDGSGYSLSLKGSDYAGNTFSWDEDKQFVIDQTIPKIFIASDKEQKGRNGQYYSADKTLMIKIKEENLRDRDLVINNQAEGGKHGEKKALMRSSLEKRGEFYYVEIKASEDGVYIPEISCTDLAGNKAAVITVPEFIIDKTAPVITFAGVRNGETFAKPFSCKICCEDKNLDMHSLEFHIFSMSGREVEDGELFSDLNVEYDKNSVCRVVKQWKDSNDQLLKDGIYRLSVKGTDLAGNAAVGKTGLLFSVNREGAVYVLDRGFLKRISDGYLRGKGDLVLRECSVNPTLTQIKIIRENQDQYLLSEHDYSKKVGMVPAGSGAWSGWIMKTICLPAELFDQDGSYRILIKTKAIDKSGRSHRIINRTDNEIKGRSLSFIVDRTPPQVRLGGLDQKIYEEKEHVFRLTVMDNVALDRVELSVEKGIIQKKKEVQKIYPKDLDEMNSILLKLKAYGGYQTIRYEAWDKAGNRLNSDYCNDSRSCLVAGINNRQDKSSGTDRSREAMNGQRDYAEKKQDEKRMNYLQGFFIILFSAFLLTGGIWIVRDRHNMKIKEG